MEWSRIWQIVVPFAGYFDCLLFSLIYLLMDLAQDFEDFPPPRVLVSNIYFWLYWLLQFLASALAFYLLKVNLLARWRDADLLVALIAVFGSSLVLQNQLIKIAGKSVVDFSGLQKGLRRQLIVQVGKVQVRRERNRILRITDKLVEKYTERKEELEDLLVKVMLAGGVDEARIQQSVERIKKRCEKLGVSEVAELARVLAQTDIGQATRAVYRHEQDS